MRLVPVFVLLATASLVGCGNVSEYERVEYPQAGPAQPMVGVTSSDEVRAERAQQRQTPVADQYLDTDPSALTDFKSTLDPYGTWVDDPTYGTVWTPSETAVGSDFAPYVSSGHWAIDANDDWEWQSDYDQSFGWVTFHYGRWVYLNQGGWGWVPGRQYAPAWVVWRTGAPGYEYVGWAPAPPYFYWHGGSVVWLSTYPQAPYVFCHTSYVFREHVGTYLVDRGHVAAVAGGTHSYASPHAGGAVAGSGHVLATPQHGPTATSGHIPAGTWPSTASRVASGNNRYASPSAMGRTPSFNGSSSGVRSAGNGFGSPTRSNNAMVAGHPQAPRSLGASTTPSASHGYSPGHSSYSPSYGGGARSYGGGSSYGGGHSYGSGFGGGYNPGGGTSTPSTSSSSSSSSSHHSSSSSPAPARSSGGGRGGGGRRGRLRRHFMKRFDSSWFVPVSFFAPLAVLAAGCFADDGSRTVYVEQPAPAQQQPAAQPAVVQIIPGATLSTDPGKGAGVFVEYLGQGQWSVWTSCDSAVKVGDCTYDIFVTPEQGTTVTGASLTPQIGTLSSDPSGADAHWVTTLDTNTLNLTLSTPGASLLVEARLDGQDDPHIFYWQGPDASGEVIHTGAPTNPATFTPTGP